MGHQRLKDLFGQYFSNNLSKDELEEFLGVLDVCKESEFSQIVDEHQEKLPAAQASASSMNNESVLDAILANIENQRVHKKAFNKFKIWKWGSAIAASFFITLGLYYYVNLGNSYPRDGKGLVNDILLKEEVVPTIIRSDGKEFQVLETIGNRIAEEGLTVTVDEKGEKLYKLTKVKAATTASRTFMSPKGTSIQLELEDGTRIWLNSGASVTYPASFANKTREISTRGEIFLSVSRNKDRPFIVYANETQIRVLGTEFNVSSDDIKGSVTTTLVEGSVEVKAGFETKTLSPGYKSISDVSGKNIRVEKADLKSSLAWMDGYFRFDNDRIERVMAKIQEWYDIDEVAYLRKSDEEFSGMIKRTKSLNDLLRQIEKISSYKFKIEDGRVLIM